jgi:hypothetical protein
MVLWSNERFLQGATNEAFRGEENVASLAALSRCHGRQTSIRQPNGCLDYI